ncbi:hypothetical protein ACHAWF_003861 [Thalassiosira exigua]
MSIVNTDKYPIHDEGSAGYCSLVESSKSQLDGRGFVWLPGFLRSEAIHDLTASVLSLERRGGGFCSADSHNVFLEGGSDCDSDDQSSSTHPARIRLKSSKLILNARDMAPYAAGLDELFASSTFVNFLSSVLRTTLHPSADPYGKYYANVFRAGDGLNWHFDRSEYSVSLILRPADEGGEFQFAPDSRDAVGGWDAMPGPDLEDARRALERDGKAVEAPTLAAGDAYVFRGRDALHRVSEVVRGTRINLILTYNAEPHVRLNRYTLQKFFGVDEE